MSYDLCGCECPLCVGGRHCYIRSTNRRGEPIGCQVQAIAANQRVNIFPPETMTVSSSGTASACNCMYGTADPRCCINRARRQQLENAWEMGRRGEPLPDHSYHIPVPLTPLPVGTVLTGVLNQPPTPWWRKVAVRYRQWRFQRVFKPLGFISGDS